MKRFGIKFPNGKWSKGGYDGPRRPVAFDKAKLWKNIGHIRNHLGQCSGAGPYPVGTEIIELEFSHTETPLFSVEDAVIEGKLRRAIREAENRLRNAEWKLQKAQEELLKALDPVERARNELDRALAQRDLESVQKQLEELQDG